MSSLGFDLRPERDGDALSAAVAEYFVEQSRLAIEQRGRFRVVLSGGSTPQALFGKLTCSPWREQVDWTRVEFFWGDERAVPADHEDSNFRMAQIHLLEPLSIDASQIHRMPADVPDLDAAARAYQLRIAEVCGAGAKQVPQLDLVFLGMGEDGHTASLFPFTGALEPTDRWVVRNLVPQLGVERLSMTPCLINRAWCVVFLVVGQGKAERLAEVLEGPQDPVRLPCQLIEPDAGNLIWWVDRAAASLLAGFI